MAAPIEIQLRHTLPPTPVTKVAKLRKHLRSVPSDFTWDELVTVLRGLDFEDISDKGGSYRTFASAAGRW